MNKKDLFQCWNCGKNGLVAKNENMFYVKCDRCNNKTLQYNNKINAIKAWNENYKFKNSK